MNIYFNIFPNYLGVKTQIQSDMYSNVLSSVLFIVSLKRGKTSLSLERVYEQEEEF